MTLEEILRRRPDFKVEKQPNGYKRASWTWKGRPYELVASHLSPLSDLIEAAARTIIWDDEDQEPPSTRR